MTIAYVDCFSGLSGDMFLGAIVDAGVSIDALRAAVSQIPIGGYHLEGERVTRQGVTGYALRVILDPGVTQPTRHLSDILDIIEGANLAASVKTRASGVFQLLAEVESGVHGTSIAEVHFHEVGAVDAIVDIVGTVWGLSELGVDQVYASSVPTGSGTVQTAHGLLPVPAPATLALLERARAPLRSSSATTELITPTGAALLASMASFQQPSIQLQRVGYGFGQKMLPWANVARLWLGEGEGRLDDNGGLETDDVVVVETNLDDELPEIIGSTIDTLLSAGALDVYFTPIQMKKNRPAVKLTVLAPPELTAKLSAVVLRETSTLGVRTYVTRRVKCPRWQASVQTPWGHVRVKVKQVGTDRRASPEYDDCVAISRQTGVPLAQVYRAAIVAASAEINGNDQA